MTAAGSAPTAIAAWNCCRRRLTAASTWRCNVGAELGQAVPGASVTASPTSLIDSRSFGPNGAVVGLVAGQVGTPDQLQNQAVRAGEVD
jgi:hypothetical protein